MPAADDGCELTSINEQKSSVRILSNIRSFFDRNTKRLPEKRSYCIHNPQNNNFSTFGQLPTTMKSLTSPLFRLCLLLLMWTASVESFGVISPFVSARSRIRTDVASKMSPSSSSAPSPYDETLSRLEKEYKLLQRELLHDLNLKHDEVAAEEVAEEMLEKAAAAVAVQKYKFQEELDRAHEELVEADAELERVQALEKEAHGDAAGAELEASLLESIDAAYEDMERVRDMSVSHASHHLEDDLKDAEIDSIYKPMEAEDREEKAAETLDRLDANLKELRNSVQLLREEKRQRAMKEWDEKKSRP